MATSLSFRSTTYTARCGAVAQSDDLGSDGRVLYATALTPCCKAAATGDAASPTGVSCKACGKSVSSRYGSNGWGALFQAAKDAGCPCASQCADHMLYKIMDEGQPV